MYRRNEEMAIDGEIFNWNGKQVNNIRKIMRFRNPQQQNRFPYNVRKNHAEVKRVKYNRVSGEHGAVIVWPMMGRTNYHYRPNLPLPNQNWDEYDWDADEKIFKFRGHRINEPGTLLTYRTSILTGAGTNTVLNERNGQLGDTVHIDNKLIEVIKDDRITQINGGINRENKADVISVYGRFYGNNNHIIINMPREFSNTVSMDYGDGYMEWANLFAVNGNNNTIIFNIDQNFTFKSGPNSAGYDRPISLIRLFGTGNKVYFNFKPGSSIQFESRVIDYQVKRWAPENYYTQYAPIPGSEYWVGPLKANWIHTLVVSSDSDTMDGSRADGFVLDRNKHYVKGTQNTPESSNVSVRFNSEAWMNLFESKYSLVNYITRDLHYIIPYSPQSGAAMGMASTDNPSISPNILAGSMTSFYSDDFYAKNLFVDYPNNNQALNITFIAWASGKHGLQTHHYFPCNNKNITINVDCPLNFRHQMYDTREGVSATHAFVVVQGKGNIVTLNIRKDISYTFSDYGPIKKIQAALVMASPGNKIIINYVGGRNNTTGPDVCELGIDTLRPYLNASDEEITRSRSS